MLTLRTTSKATARTSRPSPAGNFVQGAALRQGLLGSGTAAGIAPLAHIAAYKVCPSPEECHDSYISCAMEESIHDGVDVINISLGGGSDANTTFDKDPIAIGAFRAMAKGIVVVTAGGNDGPKQVFFIFRYWPKFLIFSFYP